MLLGWRRMKQPTFKNETTNLQRERQRRLMLDKRVTDSSWQWSAKGDSGPAEKASTTHRTAAGTDKFGRQMMQQARDDR